MSSFDLRTSRGKVATLLALVLLVGLLVAGCQNTATPTAAPATKAATTSPATAAAPTKAAATAAPSGGGANTAGTLAEKGQSVYAKSCASCHGQNGEGVTAPGVFGTGVNLGGRFATAKELDGYIRTAMPIDKPGSLSSDEYTQVTAFILLKNDLVKAGDPIDPQGLEAIRIRK